MEKNSEFYCQFCDTVFNNYLINTALDSIEVFNKYKFLDCNLKVICPSCKERFIKNQELADKLKTQERFMY